MREPEEELHSYYKTDDLVLIRRMRARLRIINVRRIGQASLILLVETSFTTDWNKFALEREAVPRYHVNRARDSIFYSS